MIKLVLSGNTQTITKVCNMCGCHIDDLEIEDILVKPKWANSDNITFKYKDGTYIKDKKFEKFYKSYNGGQENFKLGNFKSAIKK